MPKQKLPQERNWYVIHTYSGYEDAVAKNLKQRVESLGMEDKIFNVIVPKEKKIKIKNGKRKTVGVGTTPVPISLKETETLKKRTETESPQFKIEVEIGDSVKITDGPFKDFVGKVSGVDEEKGKVKVSVNMFGRDTPVELDSLQIKKL